MNKNLRPAAAAAAAYEPVQKHKVTPSILGWLNNNKNDDDDDNDNDDNYHHHYNVAMNTLNDSNSFKLLKFLHICWLNRIWQYIHKSEKYQAAHHFIANSHQLMENAAKCFIAIPPNIFSIISDQSFQFPRILKFSKRIHLENNVILVSGLETRYLPNSGC